MQRYFRGLIAVALSLPQTVLAEAIAPQPVISGNSDWVGVMLIIIAGLFLAAMVIGPMVRFEFPADLLPDHSHDEPPGSSHHHGGSGTKV